MDRRVEEADDAAMARTTITQLTDDVDGSKDAEAFPSASWEPTPTAGMRFRWGPGSKAVVEADSDAQG